MYGYHNRILHINLTVNSISTLKFPAEFYDSFYSGSGVASYILYSNFDQAEPFAQENPLTFMAGMLTGAPVPCAKTLSVCTRSPQTGLWHEDTIEGDFGSELKKAGYDGLIIIGRAMEPVYIYITDTGATILNAGHLWGQDTYVTRQELLKTHPAATMCAIGPAGETLSLMSSIVSDNLNSTTRGGMGAVMGNKNLKAVVVKSTGNSINIKDRYKLSESVKLALNSISSNIYDPILEFKKNRENGFLPVKNFSPDQSNEVSAKITDPDLLGNTNIEKINYANCPLYCAQGIKFKDSNMKELNSMLPSYDALTAFGPLCYNNDIITIIKANDLCIRYGLDPISTGSAIAFAMECYDNDLVTLDDTDDINLKWGNKESILKMVEKIAYRHGFGEVLADGVKLAAEKIGGQASVFAMHHKSLELTMYNPLSLSYMAINQITSPTPFTPDLYENEILKELDLETKELDKTIKLQNYVSAINAIGICRPGMNNIKPSLIAEWMKHVTGNEHNINDILKTGERIFTLKRIYDNDIGIEKKDDLIYPEKLNNVNFSESLDNYYKLRNWDADGTPTKQLLTKLSLI